MPLLGVTRVMAMYRMAGSMALMDAKIRNVGPDKALGGRGWDNYRGTPTCRPGHTMVTARRPWSSTCTRSSSRSWCSWGHELDHDQDARRALADGSAPQGHQVVDWCEQYAPPRTRAMRCWWCARARRRPSRCVGCHVIMREKLHDTAFVKRFTDLLPSHGSTR
ncbi:MAG: hypothetical protein U0Q55_17480 [Vicinamibacterales bacterium]